MESSASAIWQNWNPIENLGPVNLADAPVLLTVGPDNYWMFGRYGGGQPRRSKGQKSQRESLPPFEAEEATLEGVDWFNHRRLFEPIGEVPPAEFEMAYYQQREESAMAA